MSHTQVQWGRGTSGQHAGYTGPAGEVTVNTDDNSLRVHDGAKTGGWPLRAVGANYSYQMPASGTTLTAPAYLAAMCSNRPPPWQA